MQKLDPRIPKYPHLINQTFLALKALGGSGRNDDILNQIIIDMKIPDDVVDISHLGNTSMTELAYQAAWARTYLKVYGVITNSSRSVWSIVPAYSGKDSVDEAEIYSHVTKLFSENRKNSKDSNVNTAPDDSDSSNDYAEFPDEDKPWRKKLMDILSNMDPYAFERLAQRVLRECGFSQVEVTRKTGDGGIDGTGKLRINGIFSFNVAFQCKRYKGTVGAPEIRDFRGSLTTDIEKGVMITTGTFTKAAKEEASNPGKQQIDLIDGEDFMTKIEEFEIGVKPISAFEVDETFFMNI